MSKAKEALKGLGKLADLLGGTTAERMARAAEQGWNIDAYHGTTDDFPAFSHEMLGGTTGAKSSRKAFFSASNPDNASYYPQYRSEHFNDYAAASGRKILGRNAPDIDAMRAFYSDIDATRVKLDAFNSGGLSEVDDFRRGLLNELAGEPIQVRPPQSMALRMAISQTGDKRLKAAFTDKDLLEELSEGVLTREQYNEIKGASESIYENGKANLLADLDQLGLKQTAEEYISTAKKAREYGRYLDSYAWSKKSWEGGDESGEVWDASRNAWSPNVQKLKLRMENPYTHDFKGGDYRDTSYSELIDYAKKAGHDGVIFNNTLDPYPTDVYAVFEPNQIRSVNADFNPANKDSPNLLASLALPVAAGLAGTAALAPQDAEAGIVKGGVEAIKTAAMARAMKLKEMDAAHSAEIAAGTPGWHHPVEESIANLNYMKRQNNREMMDADRRASSFSEWFDDPKDKATDGELREHLIRRNQQIDWQIENLSKYGSDTSKWSADPDVFGYNEKGNATSEMLAATALASSTALAVNDYANRRASKSDYWKQKRQEVLDIANSFTDTAFKALDMPLQGYMGLAGVAGTLASGGGFDNAMQQGAMVAQQPTDATAYQYGQGVTDALSPYLPPQIAAGAGALTNAGVLMGSPL